MPKKTPVRRNTKKKTTRSSKTSKFNNLFANNRRLTMLVFIVLFAAIGSYLLFSLKAAAPSGTVTGVDRYGIAPSELPYVSPADQAKILDGIKAVGARWVRVDFAWSVVQGNGPTSYDWSRADAVVAAANARGLKLLPILGYTPAWARADQGCTYGDKCAPAASYAAAYGAFAKAAAARYAPQGVHYWEIWNEANQVGAWRPTNVVVYTQLLKSAYTNIKEADSTAIVITTGTSPAATDGTNISPVDWLSGVYSNGGKGYFDAVGAHPYCFAGSFDCPKTYAAWSAWSQMNDTPVSMRSLMVANGDGAKKIWATEFGAPTQSSQTVGEAKQAQMVTDAYKLFASYDWSGPLFWYDHHDLGTDTSNRENFFGLFRYDYSQKPSWQAYRDSVTAATATPPPPPAACPAGQAGTPPNCTTPPPAPPAPTASLSLKGLTQNQVVNGNLSLEAVPANASGISTIQFFADSANINTEQVGPWCLAGDNGSVCNAWDSRQLSDGNHTFKAVMNYSGGALTSSVTVKIQNTVIGGGTGLPVTYFNNRDFTGSTVKRTDPTINFSWAQGSPSGSIGSETFSARWVGKLQARTTETYTITTKSDDGVRVFVNGKTLISNWTNHGVTSNSATIYLVAGQKYDITVEYYENKGNATMQLLWSTPSIPLAVIPQSQLFTN